ncbi:MAG: hypothetical protein AB8G15_06495 [Saprospiraceae bacterium]
MKKNLLLLFFLISTSFYLTSCDKEEENPTLLCSKVTVSNTLQTAADPNLGGTGGVETPIETIFGLPAGALTITATVGNGLEYKDYLDGLYDINLSENQISYNLVAPADHPVYSNFFRTIESNTFDRYYFKFDRNHNISSGTSNNPSVSFSVISDSEFLVQIGEGFDFNPGVSFIINFI